MNSDNKDNKDNKENKDNKDTEFELIVRNLKIISNIKPNDKLVKHGDTIKIDTPYIYQGISRYWNGDSRKDSLSHIEELVINTFTQIDLIYGNEIEQRTGGLSGTNNYYSQGQSYFETENTQKLQIFSNELKNVISGLSNLKQTYNTDISICSRIEVVIEKINLRIKKIQELFHINISNNQSNTNHFNNDTVCFSDNEDTE